MADLDFYVDANARHRIGDVDRFPPLDLQRHQASVLRARAWPRRGLADRISRSATDMPSGGRIYRGPMTRGGDVSLSDMKGQCRIEVGAVAALAGISGMMIWFGTPGPPAFAKALGLLWGVAIETPGVGAMDTPATSGDAGRLSGLDV